MADFDFLHAPVVQLRADALSVMLSKTGYWIRIISGRRSRGKMEHCTVVYDHGNKLEDVHQDKEPILVIFFVS